MDEFRKILYPTDFSEHSLAALPYVTGMVEAFGAELHCLHVVDDTFQYMLAGTDNTVPVVMSDTELEELSQRHLEEFVEKHLGSVKERLTAKVVPGKPFVEIIRYAREQEMDLIIIPTHGRGALASMLLGSVTEKVVRKASCPVLTVRHSEHVFEMP